MTKVAIPRGKFDGTGRVLYRCATCGELMEPAEAARVDGKTYHPEHITTKQQGGSHGR